MQYRFNIHNQNIISKNIKNDIQNSLRMNKEYEKDFIKFEIGKIMDYYASKYELKYAIKLNEGEVLVILIFNSCNRMNFIVKDKLKERKEKLEKLK